MGSLGPSFKARQLVRARHLTYPRYTFSPSHFGSCTLRVSTFATIVDHTFPSSVIWSSGPCSLMSLLILSIHLMRGLPLGLFPGISISSTVLVMSSGFLRFICPYQLSRRLVTWSTIGTTFSLFRISSLLTWSFKRTEHYHLGLI